MATKYLSVRQANMLKQHRYILDKLTQSSIKDRKTILRNSPSILFKVLKLIFKLLTNGKLVLNRKQKQSLKKHEKFIHSVNTVKALHIKRKLLAQRGESLATVLKTVLPIIVGIVKLAI